MRPVISGRSRANGDPTCSVPAQDPTPPGATHETDSLQHASNRQGISLPRDQLSLILQSAVYVYMYVRLSCPGCHIPRRDSGSALIGDATKTRLRRALVTRHLSLCYPSLTGPASVSRAVSYFLLHSGSSSILTTSPKTESLAYLSHLSFVTRIFVTVKTP